MAQYKNIKTGFVFSTECELQGEDWEKLSPSPVITKETVAEEVEEKPVKTKRTKK